MPPFLDRLHESRQLLLDGATGTELNRRGVSTELPLWSARALVEAPGVLRDIHGDYVVAGAEVVTANTFRTHRRNLAHAGWGNRAAELTRFAVEIARDAADGRAWVVGSQPPLEDCYSPQLTPGDAELADEHAEMSANLAAARVDAILAETHNTIREAVAAVTAAAETGLPVLVGFVCGTDGRLLSGESLSDAANAVLPMGPAAILVNCIPAESALPMLEELQSVATGVPRGAYANIGRPDPVEGWINTNAQDPECYAAYAESWLQAGATILGGCCGTMPEHIRRLRVLIDQVT